VGFGLPLSQGHQEETKARDRGQGTKVGVPPRTGCDDRRQHRRRGPVGRERPRRYGMGSRGGGLAGGVEGARGGVGKGDGNCGSR
jgi:hypothetical protein